MFTGQIDQISNRADWIAPFFAQIVTDGEILNILNPDIGFDCEVTISDLECRHHRHIIGSISNGKVIASAGDDGPGFQWPFVADDLKCLRAGTYHFGIKTTTNGQVMDLVDGTLAVIEGN